MDRFEGFGFNCLTVSKASVSPFALPVDALYKVPRVARARALHLRVHLLRAAGLHHRRHPGVRVAPQHGRYDINCIKPCYVVSYYIAL